MTPGAGVWPARGHGTPAAGARWAALRRRAPQGHPSPKQGRRRTCTCAQATLISAIRQMRRAAPCAPKRLQLYGAKSALSPRIQAKRPFVRLSTEGTCDKLGRAHGLTKAFHPALQHTRRWKSRVHPFTYSSLTCRCPLEAEAMQSMCAWQKAEQCAIQAGSDLKLL